MKSNILLGIASIYMALVGLGLIFAPRAFGAGAVPADASAELIAYLRLWGSPLLGIAVLNWMSRYAEPSRARTAVLLGNLVGFAAIAALDVWGSFSGGRAATKAFALIHILFAAAFIRAVWTPRHSRPEAGGPRRTP